MRKRDLPIRIATLVVAALAATHVLIYVEIARRTIAYPYPLEWVEGGTLDVVTRINAGLPTYVQPTVEYVPYVYTPMYYWLTAGIARAIGVDFFAGRIVSFAAVVGVVLIIGSFVKREGGGWLGALVAVGLFLGTYQATERMFHLARVDSLFLFCLLCAFYTLRFGSRTSSAIVAGALLWLSFMTKQSALFTAAIALPIMAAGSWRRPLIAGVVFAALAGATSVIMDGRTGVWWSYYVWQLPRQRGWTIYQIYMFWFRDLGKTLPLAVLGSAALVVGLARRDRERALWFSGLLAGMVVMSWLSRAHTGGAGNVLMPAYASLAIAMPLGLQQAARTPFLRVAIALALAAQLAVLFHPSGAAIPTAADQAAGDRFVDRLRRIDGEVLIFDQRFVQTRAGKKSWALDAADEILESNDATARAAMLAQIVAELTSGRVAGAIDPPRYLLDAVTFRPPEDLFAQDDVFWTVSGARRRPSRYYAVQFPGH